MGSSGAPAGLEHSLWAHQSEGWFFFLLAWKAGTCLREWVSSTTTPRDFHMDFWITCAWEPSPLLFLTPQAFARLNHQYFQDSWDLHETNTTLTYHRLGIRLNKWNKCMQQEQSFMQQLIRRFSCVTELDIIFVLFAGSITIAENNLWNYQEEAVTSALVRHKPH